MSVMSRSVARINLVGFESFEARTWQLFICNRCVPFPTLEKPINFSS